MPCDVVNSRLSDFLTGTLVEHAIEYYPEILYRGVTISRGGEFMKYDGNKELYRSIIMPMSEDGRTISGLLCAANCREVSRE